MQVRPARWAATEVVELPYSTPSPPTNDDGLVPIVALARLPCQSIRTQSNGDEHVRSVTNFDKTPLRT